MLSLEKCLLRSFAQFFNWIVFLVLSQDLESLETVKVPIGKWEDKKAVVHLYNGIPHSYKKEGNLILCDSMDGPGEYCAKCQWEKDKYRMISPISEI